MTAAQLIVLLQQVNPEAEVMLATQQNYPLQAYVRGVYDPAAADDDDCDDCGGEGCSSCCKSPDEPERVWIVEGGQDRMKPYGPRKAWDACATA